MKNITEAEDKLTREELPETSLKEERGKGNEVAEIREKEPEIEAEKEPEIEEKNSALPFAPSPFVKSIILLVLIGGGVGILLLFKKKQEIKSLKSQ